MALILVVELIIAGAIRLGKELGPGKTIVTILCDKSDKYATKMFNKSFLEEKGLPFPTFLSIGLIKFK